MPENELTEDEARIPNLERQVAELRDTLGEQSRRLEAIEQWNRTIFEVLQRRGAETRFPAETVPLAPRPRSSAAASTSGAAPTNSISGAAPTTSFSGPAPSTDPPAHLSDVESASVGSILSRIAAVVTILAVGFFLKLASESGWITEPARIFCGGLIGGGLIAAGEIIRQRRMHGYSYGLSGAGFAILYLSAYFAYGIYHLVGWAPAFAVLAAITTATVVRAVSLNAEPIAALGMLGGFLTPVILSGGSGGSASGSARLFLYVWMLDLGVLAAASLKDWAGLKTGSLALTQLLVGFWVATHLSSDLLPVLAVSGTALFLLFIGVAIAYHLVWKKPVSGPDLFLILENPALYTVLMLGCFFQKSPLSLAVWFLAIGAGYTLVAWGAVRRDGWNGPLAGALVAVAVGFVTVATALALGGNSRSCGWAAEALMLLWTGCRTHSRPLRSASYVLYSLLGLSLAYSIIEGGARMMNEGSRLLFLNAIELPLALAVIASLAGEWTVRESRSGLDPAEIPVPGVLAASAYAAGWVWVTLEVLHREAGWGSGLSVLLSVAWALYAAILLAYGILSRRRQAQISGLVILALVIGKVFLFDIWQSETIYGVISLGVLAVVLWGASYPYSRYRDRITKFMSEET